MTKMGTQSTYLGSMKSKFCSNHLAESFSPVPVDMNFEVLTGNLVTAQRKVEN